jgi:transcriptional regulator with XRE-family HTH domain
MIDSIRNIGNEIREGRKLLGVSQIQLADLAGTSYRPVHLIENGHSIRLETLVKLCDALGYELSIAPRGPIAHD